jgi:hypothetical protein
MLPHLWGSNSPNALPAVSVLRGGTGGKGGSWKMINIWHYAVWSVSSAYQNLLLYATTTSTLVYIYIHYLYFQSSNLFLLSKWESTVKLMIKMQRILLCLYKHYFIDNPNRLTIVAILCWIRKLLSSALKINYKEQYHLLRRLNCI